MEHLIRMQPNSIVYSLQQQISKEGERQTMTKMDIGAWQNPIKKQLTITQATRAVQDKNKTTKKNNRLH
uniref:Uncharacterized protein n=1 Tax=Arion vulgaris TaxID=1028688 RepID=A0A0B7A5H9_9EUPU